MSTSGQLTLVGAAGGDGDGVPWTDQPFASAFDVDFDDREQVWECISERSSFSRLSDRLAWLVCDGSVVILDTKSRTKLAHINLVRGAGGHTVLRGARTSRRGGHPA